MVENQLQYIERQFAQRFRLDFCLGEDLKWEREHLLVELNYFGFEYFGLNHFGLKYFGLKIWINFLFQKARSTTLIDNIIRDEFVLHKNKRPRRPVECAQEPF